MSRFVSLEARKHKDRHHLLNRPPAIPTYICGNVFFAYLSFLAQFFPTTSSRISQEGTGWTIPWTAPHGCSRATKKYNNSAAAAKGMIHETMRNFPERSSLRKSDFGKFPRMSGAIPEHHPYLRKFPPLGKGRLPSSSISLNLLPLCEQALLACESGVSHDASSGIACFMSGV